MTLVEVLQGKWLGHPLHPALVHVPVGAWTAACVADVVTALHPDSVATGEFAATCVVAGLLAALAAVPTGIAEWRPIKRGKPAWRIALWHLVLNALATLLWAVNLWLRWRVASHGFAAVLATSIAATVLLIAGGYLGTLLAFERGISVARQSKKKWRGVARGGARLADSK